MLHQNPENLVGTQLKCSQTQLKVTIIEYAADFWTGTETFEGFRVTYPDGMTHIISCDRVGKDYLPASWVLADLFDVDAMTLEVPDHVYEADVSIGFMTCPDCEGEGWIEVEGSAWANPSWYHFKFTNLKPCTKCHCEGQVFTMLEPLEVPDEGLVQDSGTFHLTWPLAA